MVQYPVSVTIRRVRFCRSWSGGYIVAPGAFIHAFSKAQ